MVTAELSPLEETLIEGWESVYKMGQLSLWLMLAIKDGPKHMAQIKQFIQDCLKGVLTADDKSIYRALRRYQKAGLIGFTVMPNSNGPDLKVYTLTEVGQNVLARFLERNIKVFYSPSIRNLIEKGEG